MNVTNLKPRPQRILDFLAKNPSQTRTQITNNLFPKGEVSRITIIRDLNFLKDLGFITIQGRGRYVRYALSPKYWLLAPVDLDHYFSKDVDTRAVKYPQFNFKIFAELSELLDGNESKLFEQGAKRLAEKFNNLDKSILKRELERFTIELSWKSSQIEGNTYSLLETEELVKNKKEAPGHTKEEAIMILNHKKAFDTMLENKNKYKEISLSDVRTIHTELVENLGVTTGIRKQGVGITGTAYKPLDSEWKIKEALGKLFKLTKNTKGIPEKALIFLLMISYIQPFADGNKRTARMVSNAILLANGYFPLSYRSVDEVEYKKALVIFYEKNNIHHLKKIFLEQQKFAIENYFV